MSVERSEGSATIHGSLPLYQPMITSLACEYYLSDGSDTNKAVMVVSQAIKKFDITVILLEENGLEGVVHSEVDAAIYCNAYRTDEEMAIETLEVLLGSRAEMLMVISVSLHR